MKKTEIYNIVLASVHELINNEKDTIAIMANVAALLKEEFNFWWVGFYRVIGNQLVLGPFQGPLACTRISFGRGVCGAAWQKKHTIIVPDVHKFPGHIACSSVSRSEIVVPIINNGEVKAVLDIDSEFLNSFDNHDCSALEQIASLIASTFNPTLSPPSK